MSNQQPLLNYEVLNIEKAIQRLSCIDFSDKRAIECLRKEILEAIDQNHTQHEDAHEIGDELDLEICNCQEYYKKEQFFMSMIESLNKLL